jgi:hypothetical protein
MTLDDHKDLLEAIKQQLKKEAEAIFFEKEAPKKTKPKPLISFAYNKSKFVSRGWYEFSYRLRSFLIGSERTAFEQVIYPQ